MTDLPEGVVTFLFSDVEGSTALLERHGAAMGDVLAGHHELFEQHVTGHHGIIFETVGDAVYAAFASPAAAVGAALDVQRGLTATDWGPIERLAVRIGLHAGSVERRGTHYFGATLFRAARLMACGHGGQVLLSGVTAELVGQDLPSGASLRNLGIHRLKDLGVPEQIHQLVHPELRGEFPALRSLDAHPHNLPIQLSSFVGRGAELATLTELLSAHRLVTLIGPGGIGKTRLALQAAAERLEAFDDGVWFIDLAPLRDPELVPGVIASTLGLREPVGQTVRAALAEYLRARKVLLVLDNLEQLLPAAAASVAELLGTAPGLRILATSRAPLRLRGEREYAVPPLAAGSAEHLEAEPPPAVALFLERAREIRPELAVTSRTGPLIAAVCARLDGLPLAIELAAARLRLFSLSQLHERLNERLPLLTGGARDLPERQQTLQATIAWSTELLSPDARRLFAALGVFRGGFTLEAAEAVAGVDLDITAGLTSLIEQSLIRPVDDTGDEPRYTMLETVREAAAGQLDASGQGDAVRRRHIDYFLALAEAAEPNLRGSPKEWLDRLEPEHDNIRGALDRLEAWDETHGALQLAGAVWRFWQFRGYLAEGLRRLEGLLARDVSPTSARARALNGLAAMAIRAGLAERARAPAEEALPLHEAAGDAFGVAISSFLIGMTFAHEGEFERASGLLAESARGFREVGDDHYALLSNRMLAWVCDELGDGIRARALYEETLEQARTLGNNRVAAMTLEGLARLAVGEGRMDDGAAHISQAYEIHRNMGDLAALSADLCVSARLLAGRGNLAAATQILARALALRKEIGAAQNPWMTRMNEETLRAVHAELGAVALADEQTRGEALSVDDAVALAVSAAAPDSREAGGRVAPG